MSGASTGSSRSAWFCDIEGSTRLVQRLGDGYPAVREAYAAIVRRAARIAEAGHGGQVLVSAATRGLVEHALPRGPCRCS